MNKESQEMWDYHYKKLNDKGYKRLYNYFLDISKTKPFSDQIRRLRKKYDIPKDGFSKTDHTGFVEWSDKHNQTYSKPLFQEVYEICEKFFLPKEWWKAVMEAVFHNSEDPNDLGFGTTSGLCVIDDLGTESKDYPVAIRINPYASERDILEFVKLTYQHEIKPKLKKYRNKASLVDKVKTKNPEIQGRNDFIYKNRHLPLKEIRSMLGKKKIFLDDGHISKVISLERKKRKDV